MGSSSIEYSALTVDHTLSPPQMKPRLIELCKDLFKSWSNLESSCFSVETVSGGITNLLLKVSVKEGSGSLVSVTVRLYGPNTEYVIDRERELQAITYISAAGFGAKLLGVFGNGMVQSFINARTLAPLDLRKPKLAAKIAKQLHRFHQVEVPGSKEPQLWHEVQKFFQNASTLTFDDNEKQLKYDVISFKEVGTEIHALKDLSARLDSPVVFAHNDLLSGNLMFNDEKEKLYFIDFEYGSYNYRGFDIGNHFNEYAGYDCDYSLYPSKDEQINFFRHYLKPGKPYEVEILKEKPGFDDAFNYKDEKDFKSTLKRRLTFQGFLATDFLSGYGEFLTATSYYLQSGKCKHSRTSLLGLTTLLLLLCDSFVAKILGNRWSKSSRIRADIQLFTMTILIL